MHNLIRRYQWCNRYLTNLSHFQLILIHVFVFSCIILHYTLSIGICSEKTVIINLQFRNASELLPVVRDMISRDGQASVDIRTNSIILSDNPESIEYIRGFIDRLDKPLKQLKVNIKVQELSGANNSSTRAKGRISGRNWEAKTHGQRQDGINVQMDARSSKRNEESEFFINVQSGGVAYIMVGEEILFSNTWDSLLRKYSDYTGEFTSKKIESGLEVRPIIIGDHVDIEITPRISNIVKKHERDIIRFTEMSTYLSVNVGQWVTISGMDKANNEVMKEILGKGMENESSSFTVSLMVEVR